MAGTIAYTDGYVVIVNAGPSELDCWTQAFGVSSWTKQTVASGAFSSPSIVWTGSSVIITAVADPENPNPNLTQGSLYACSLSFPAPGIVVPTPMVLVSNPPFGGLYASPSIAWTGSNAVITASNIGTSLDYWWQDSTGTWHHEPVATGDYFSQSIAWTGSSVVIVAPGDGGSLNSWSQQRGASGWPSPQSIATATPGYIYASPSIAWTGSNMVATAVEVSGTTSDPSPQGGNLYYWWQDGTGAWHQEPVVTGNYVTPSIASTTCSVVITAVEASGAGTAGNLYSWSQQRGTSQWPTPQTLATGSYGAPAIASTSCSAAITAQSEDIYCWFQGTPPWNIETVS